MLLRRDGDEPLFTYYKIPLIENPNKMKIFETTSKAVLKETIKDLLCIRPKNEIIPYHDLQYMVGVAIDGCGGEDDKEIVDCDCPNTVISIEEPEDQKENDTWLEILP